MIDASVASAGVSPSVLLRCIEPSSGSGGSVDHRGQGAELLLSPGWCWLWLAAEGSLLLDGEGTHDSSLPLPLPGPGVLHPGHVTSAWVVTRLRDGRDTIVTRHSLCYLTPPPHTSAVHWRLVTSVHSREVD